MRLQYKLIGILLVAFLVPVVAIGLSGYLSIRRMGDRAADESMRTLVEAERLHLQDATRAKALEIEQMCEVYQNDVEHLRSRFERTHKELESYRLDRIADRYPGKEKAGLPGYGYVHPVHGAYADFDALGPGGPWVPRKVVDKLKGNPQLRTRVTRGLHTVMLLDADLVELAAHHQGTLDLAWIVLETGVTDAFPEYDYTAMLARDPALADVDENQQDYVTLASPKSNPQRQTRWLAPYLDRFKGVWMTSCVAPVYDGDLFLGTVGMDILLNVISHQILQTRIGQTGYALLTGPDGRLIALPDVGIKDVLWDENHEKAMRESTKAPASQHWTEEMARAASLSLAHSPNPDLRELVSEMDRGSAGTREIVLAGDRRFVSWSPIRNSGWSLALVIPKQELIAPSSAVRLVVSQGVDRTLRDYLALGAFVAGLSILVGIFLHYLAIRPLARFTRQVESVRWDNLSFPLPAKERHDEIGQLYRKFAEMIQLMRRARDETTSQGEALEAANRKLTEANVELTREINDRARAETEKARLEEALITAQKLESIGLLAAGIAHDFNNLLTSILGNISLSRSYARSGRPVEERLQDAEQATHRARHLTAQLLTFSTGGAPVRKALDIREVVRPSGTFALRGSATRCDFLLPDDLWSVVADEGQLGQVVQNLVINAEQSMPSGGTIRIKASNREVTPEDSLPLRAGSYVCVEVHDEGVGIPRDDLPRIFDPFFTTKPRGHGLGLAVCYSIVQRHDGHIAAESTPGSGTVVRFYLPAVQQLTASPPSASSAPRTGAGRILVLDDDAMIRSMATSMLADLGYEPTVVDDGRSAIEAYKLAVSEGRPFQAVILDLTVPGGIGGLETMGQLREIDPEVCAIVSSGYSIDDVMGNIEKHGFRESLPKPFDMVSLGAALADAIGRRRA
ncbi:MAG: response regulator [Deltaproteobacteria bacterium]|nr:response regulator [Deltaproteobacteria bacterium]